MEALLKKRRSISSQIKLLESSVSEVESLSSEFIHEYQTQLISLRKENTDLHDAISGKCTDEGYEQHERHFFDMAERINTLKVALDVMLSKRIDITMDSTLTTMQLGTSSRKALEVRLPRLDLPVFSGDLVSWLGFHDLFKALIHENPSLTGAQKLQYLKASLKGEPSLLIQSVPIADSNYPEAWGLLIARYECKREIIRTHLDRLVSQPSVSGNSASALRQLIDTTSECFRSLEVMRLTKEEMFDAMVIHLVLKKLDSESRLQWERSLTEVQLPTLDAFLKFLDRHARVSAAVLPSGLLPKIKTPVLKKVMTVQQEPLLQCCVVCKGAHAVYKCETFLKFSVQERIDTIKRLGLCFNCLRRGHGARQCSSGQCRQCQKRHHTLIHISEEPKEVIASPVVGVSHGTSQVLLATALIKVQNGYGSSSVCRAFLDGGSQASFMTEHCAQRLRLPRQAAKVSISGLASVGVGTVRSSVQVSFSGLNKTGQFRVTAFVMLKIANLLPSFPVSKVQCAHLRNFELADPSFFKPGHVDVLLGADVYGLLMRSGYFCGGLGRLVAIETALGWVVMGPVGEQVPSSPSHQLAIHHVSVDTDALLQRFWEVENVPHASVLTEEERMCEEHFASTYTRDKTGRFEVRLPFKRDSGVLGESRDIAFRRFLQVERRLMRDVNLSTQYVKFMEEYRLLGHMSKVQEPHLEVNGKSSFYLPHHPVMKTSSSTTRLRVVFDASAKSSSGTSLNDKLMVGPKLQEDLFNLLVRFRLHIIAMVADIEKMYRQVRVHPSDTNYQRILWRTSPELPVEEFLLHTVTYGTASAPYQAVKCIQQLAELNKTYPAASAIVKRYFYMDDLMSGAPSPEKALRLQQQLIALLRDGGFELRKWTSNCPAVMQAVSQDLRGSQALLQICDDDSVKLLGVRWHPASDCFSFAFSHNLQLVGATKRSILSSIARVFDPLGWLSPVTVGAKIMFQELWKENLDWDSPLPGELGAKWSKYHLELKKLEDIKIERCLVSPDSVTYQLYGFCDASEKAYAAVVYLRTDGLGGEAKTQLIAAKTRVAPVKFLSLPRLELCSAVLLVNLLDSISKTLYLKIEATCCFSDSTIVLAWLASPSHRWKTFVANRVSMIQDYEFMWRHVSSEENPADCASRGILHDELINHPLWWSGPTGLLDRQLLNETCDLSDIVVEERKETVCAIVNLDPSLIDRFSSLSVLQRVVAYCFRFTKNARLPRTNREFGPLTVDELQKALLGLVRLVQQAEFSSELQCLQRNKPLPSKSKLCCLHPFVDEVGILRVGGRLSQSGLAYQTKHPMILPRKSTLTNLIVSREHLRLLHAGPQLLLAVVQRTFWILSGRDVVRRIVQRCLVCHRQRASTSSQLMADLPSSRVLPSVGAFISCGVDFGGPFTLRVLKGRGQKTFKGYVALFVCFATRAIHLELVSDLSADAFLATLKRFISRRGRPSHMYSDCGTNFVGANNQLDGIVTSMKKVCSEDAVFRFLSEEGIRWHFNPPGTPHFGGLWEAGIKSVKYHLRRVIGDVALNFEDMATVLSQIEACLNSRPLTQLTSDPSDFSPLTPGHFLVGRALSALPEPDYSTLPVNRLSRWQLLQKLVQDFWKRWQSEYLVRLQQRPKWQSKRKDPKVGDLVLLKKEGLAPLHWKLGRITELHSGPDQLVRVVTVRTVDGQQLCPIVKISPLPLEEDNI